MSFSISRSILNLLIIGCISIFIFVSCDELEPVNPADPAYTLTAPTLVSAQAITDVQIDIKWQDNEEHSEEFVIQRSSGSQSYITIANVSKDVLSYGDTSCTLGISYTYAIICKVESNISTISNAITTATVFPAATNISLHALSDEVMEIS